MAIDQDPKPQTEQKHPDEWSQDLNPDRLAGQNIGAASETRERMTRTAYDVKPVHRALREMKDDELKQIPVIDAGTRLRQGATYLDLERGAFTATAEMSVGASQTVIPKDGVHYETWNKLVGEPKP
jgi:hypothetical protein